MNDLAPPARASIFISPKTKIMLRLGRTNTLAQRRFLFPLLILGEGEGEVARYGPRHRFRLRPLTLHETTTQNYSRFEVSHVNGDEPAELVLSELNAKLISELGAAHAGYKLVYDRETICPGEEWRMKIYEWLEECPAALILLSPMALDPSKPWVANESFYLFVRRRLRGEGNLVIVPIFIGGTEQQVGKGSYFEPASVAETKSVVCSDAADKSVLGRLIIDVANALKLRGLRPLHQKAPEGLAGAIARFLARYPEAHDPMGRALDSVSPATSVNEIAMALVEADEEHIGRAFRAFADAIDLSSPEGSKRQKLLNQFCRLLAAQRGAWYSSWSFGH